ncbi:MAG: hypothetical protein P8170_16875, partial [Gemmatimonadota bacterium]
AAAGPRLLSVEDVVVDMGWSNLMLRMSRGGAMERRRVRHSMELFAKEVMPAVRELEDRRQSA